MKKICAIAIAALMLLTSCSGGLRKYEKYQSEFSELFDVYTVVIGYTQSKRAFDQYAEIIYDRIYKLHCLYDIYNDYPGVNNLKTVNDNAGIAPIAVDSDLIDLLEFSQEAYAQSGGAVNVAMGPVLTLWHDHRESGSRDSGNASIPVLSQLQLAAENTDIANLEIDREAGTVFLKKPGMSLDVGALAKGYAAQAAIDAAVSAGMESVLINMGGNVVTAGKPLDGKRDRWSVGIQDPRPEIHSDTPILDTVYVNKASVVTSGDYQRFYIVEGKRYSHIIDPKTLMPAEQYAAVTILHEDSAIAELLSTSLFILPVEQGQILLNQYGAEAMWVHHDDSIEATDGYKQISQKLGNYSATD